MNIQGIVYASTSLPNPTGSTLLTSAIQKFLATVQEEIAHKILWSLHYSQRHASSSVATNPNLSHINSGIDSDQTNPSMKEDHIIQLPDLAPGLVLEDSALKIVQEAWEKIVGNETGEGFMVFEDREGLGEDAGDEDDLGEELAE